MTKWKHVFRIFYKIKNENLMFWVNKYSTTLLWHSKLRSRASDFLLSSLRCLYNWIGGPPVATSIDWTWFRKKHTVLYKVPQLTVNIRAETKPGVGLVVWVAAWDPRVLSSSSIGRLINTPGGWLSLSSFRSRRNESQCVLVEGPMHQRHCRTSKKW